MGSSQRARSPSSFTPSEQWLISIGTVLVCGFVLYLLYEAVMATASELLQRLLVISPLVIVITVHWLSSGGQLNIPIPGSEPSDFHRAGGSPWGVAFVLLLVVVLVYNQPSTNVFIIFLVLAWLLIKWAYGAYVM